MPNHGRGRRGRKRLQLRIGSKCRRSGRFRRLGVWGLRTWWGGSAGDVYLNGAMVGAEYFGVDFGGFQLVVEPLGG